MFNVGSLDPDGLLRELITELYPEQAGRPYAFAERLAEYGVGEMGRLHEAGQLRFRELLSLGTALREDSRQDRRDEADQRADEEDGAQDRT